MQTTHFLMTMSLMILKLNLMSGLMTVISLEKKTLLMKKDCLG